MKRLFKTLASILTLSLVCVATADAQGLKLRKMNFNKVLAEYWKTTELQEANTKERVDVEKENADKQGKIQEFGKEVEALRKQLQDRNVPKPQREKLATQFQRKAHRLQSMQNQHKDYMQGLVNDLDRRNRAQNSQHIKEIRDAVKKYMEKNKLDGVLDEASIVAMKESYDVTEQIIKMLNEGQNKKDVEKKEPKPEKESNDGN